MDDEIRDDEEIKEPHTEDLERGSDDMEVPMSLVDDEGNEKADSDDEEEDDLDMDDYGDGDEE